MPDYVPTNAASSGVRLDKKTLKSIATRTDRPGLIWLAQWTLGLVATGTLVWAALGTVWVWPAMLLHGTLLTVPAYAASHETAHGTAFRSRWLNEAVLWVSSFIFIEEPLHRRYSHTNHHTHTWHVGEDSQMPYNIPLRFAEWFAATTGIIPLIYHVKVLYVLATRNFSDMILKFTPEPELPKMTRNARIMIALYVLIAVLPLAGIWWPVWFIILPRVLGTPVMILLVLIQHAELQENSPSILESTRSFTTNRVMAFLYMNMNNHVEHHLYPQVPFHALPKLAEAVKDQVPEPDHGFVRTCAELGLVVLRRSLGRSTKAPTIRQAPRMITDGGPIHSIAQKTM
ncbi:fatty acid desaturase [Ruegeria marina]|uniref:Fatty acid desaturase n=1 Tax=Ruegeria marina TaxID=639004 RepID=A0A1G7EDV2_9RHOB|nr:fatty acid desaturase [Ruegeria marina]SDE61797.1 Fatty acid desaturase [Ruegeria marina]